MVELIVQRPATIWLLGGGEHSGKNPLGSTESGKYCVCRGLDSGSFVIQCDECRDLFHSARVNMIKEYAEKPFFICAMVVTIS